MKISGEELTELKGLREILGITIRDMETGRVGVENAILIARRVGKSVEDIWGDSADRKRTFSVKGDSDAYIDNIAANAVEKKVHADFSETICDLIIDIIANDIYISENGNRVELVVTDKYIASILREVSRCKKQDEIKDIVGKYSRTMCKHDGKIMTLGEKERAISAMNDGMRALGIR